MSASREDRPQAEEEAQRSVGASHLLHRLCRWAEPALWAVLVALASAALATGMGVRP
jgi:hypothetical protein